MPQIVSPPEAQQATQTPVITTCPHCNYTISYTEDEVERVTNDGVGVLCPNCEEPIVAEYIEPFTFPDTFYHFGSGDEVNPLSDEETQHYVDIVKRILQQKCKVGEYTVAKDYWEESVFQED